MTSSVRSITEYLGYHPQRVGFQVPELA